MDGTGDGVSLVFGGLEGFFTSKVLDRRVVIRRVTEKRK